MANRGVVPADRGARLGRIGIVVVWAVALVGSVTVIALAASGARLGTGDDTWPPVYAALGVVFAVSVLAALGLELASRHPEGFVGRASASVAGAAAVLTVAALAAIPFA